MKTPTGRPLACLSYISDVMNEHPIIHDACINLDWLAFSVLLLPSPAEKDAHAFTFNPLPPRYRVVELTGTNIYARRLIVYRDDGRKMLTLLCNPHSRLIPYNSALVEVANEWLYYPRGWVLDMLQDLHPFTIQCLSRLDVAFDFELKPHQWDIIHALAVNELYVAGKREGSQFHLYTAPTGQRFERVPKCLSWGSKHSNIKWKCYNKSLELFEPDKSGNVQCSKPYIVEQWRRRGLDERRVWRLEVSLSPAAKFKFHDRRLKVADTDNAFFVSDLFISLYMNRFVIRHNDGHRDRSNDRREYLLGDYGQTDRVVVWEPEERTDRPVVEYAAALNAAMLQLQKPEVLVNQAMAEVWAAAAMETVRLGKLAGYFHDTYGYDATEIWQRAQNALQSPPPSKPQ